MVRTSWSIHACFEYVARTSQEIRTCLRKLKQYAIACVRGTGQLNLCLLVEYVLWIFASNSAYVEVRFHDCAALMMKDHPYHGHSFNCLPITGLNRPAINTGVYSTRHILPSSGLHWFPREIDCPKRAAPDPHTIVLCHLFHEFRLIVCTSYTNSSCTSYINSSCCTLLYSFILWFSSQDCTNCCSA